MHRGGGGVGGGGCSELRCINFYLNISGTRSRTEACLIHLYMVSDMGSPNPRSELS